MMSARFHAAAMYPGAISWFPSAASEKALVTEDRWRVEPPARPSVSTATIDPFGIDRDLSFNSVTIGTDGLPLIAYSNTSGAFWIAHLSNSFGVPYFRRR